MQVVILCGGLGTRLREETEFRPKPMVNIGDRPILWHLMKYYAQFGHQEFILPLGYKGDLIKQYFFNYELMNNDVTVELGSSNAMCMHECHQEQGWKITMVNTGDKTLKGGRIKRVERFVQGERFMLTYGDGVADVDLDELLDFHLAHGKMATLTGIIPTARFGKLKIGNNDGVLAFREKSIDENNDFINGGFFVFEKRFLDYLTTDCDLEFGPLERLAEEGQLMVFRHKGFWSCMDTIRDMEFLNGLWEAGRAEWKVWD